MEKTVLDSIDLPIRDLVININRLGLQTVFSCCGFTYPDEEEPKSHAPDAFVIFKDPYNTETFYIFLIITDLALKCGWKVMKYSPGSKNADGKYSLGQWVIRFEPTKEQKEFWAKPSLHDYELYSIAIYGLNNALNGIPTHLEKFSIVDGNAWYHEQGIHWQIEPKPSVTFGLGQKEENIETDVDSVTPGD